MASRQKELIRNRSATAKSILPANAALLLAVTVSACASVDLRGQGITNSSGAQAPRPETRQDPAPDVAGPATGSEDDAITFDGKRYVEAREGDTPESIASRYGVDIEEFTSLNLLSAGVPLQRGRMLELPPEDEASSADQISDIASRAIGSPVSDLPAESAGQAASSPYPNQLVHIVAPGETAFSIADSYGISVRTLAEWNALEPPDFQIRMNQRLLIPRIASAPTNEPDADNVTANTELPEQTSAADASPPRRAASEQSASADASQPEQPAKTAAELSVGPPQFMMPMQGEIVLGYSSAPGGNAGIDIAAPAGTPVVAAGDGEVSIVSPRQNGTVIMLIRHPRNYHTVYTNLTDVALEKGAKVSKGQMIGRIAGEGKNVLHFEVRIGTRAEDPIPFISGSGS